jgi:hypothetical protein
MSLIAFTESAEIVPWCGVQLTFDDPFRAVTYALIPLVLAVLFMAEAVVFLRRWELYLTALVILFVGVVASFAFGYAAMITMRRAALQDAAASHAAPVSA